MDPNQQYSQVRLVSGFTRLYDSLLIPRTRTFPHLNNLQRITLVRSRWDPRKWVLPKGELVASYTSTVGVALIELAFIVMLECTITVLHPVGDTSVDSRSTQLN